MPDEPGTQAVVADRTQSDPLGGVRVDMPPRHRNMRKYAVTETEFSAMLGLSVGASFVMGLGWNYAEKWRSSSPRDSATLWTSIILFVVAAMLLSFFGHQVRTILHQSGDRLRDLFSPPVIGRKPEAYVPGLWQRVQALGRFFYNPTPKPPELSPAPVPSNPILPPPALGTPDVPLQVADTARP